MTATVGAVWYFPASRCKANGHKNIGLQRLGSLGQLACAGSYAEVVHPGKVRVGDQVRIERSESPQDALAAAIDYLG